MFTVYIDMRILIDKALKHFYMVWESLILCWHGNILVYVTLKENTISNMFTIYVYIVQIPTQKDEHSWNSTELSLKRKEGNYLRDALCMTRYRYTMHAISMNTR